jgi:meiosis-specific transcription factor NDT80
MPLETYGSAYQSAATHAGHSAMIESPPFNQQENYGTITSGGTTVIPNIEAKIEKGFFLSSNHVWTCYRRNSFAINVSFSLTPWTPNARLYIEQGNGKAPEQIQSMAVSLTAAVDGHTGKTIELIQQTPKRNNGPQLPMKKELLTPNPPSKNHDYSAYSLSNFYQSQAAPGPQLPLQTDNKSSQSYSPTSHPSSKFLHAFERIQFKTATANNSKRRAQQQYYCLIVELWANIQTQREDSPRWVKVAAKLSHPVVVRGRSPSHYYHEKLYKAAARDPGSSNYGGAGQNGMSSRGSNAYSTHGNVLSGVGATAMGGSVYSGSTYFLDPSPSGSHSISSASSMSGGPAEGLVGDQHMVDDDAREEKRVKTTSIDADLRTSAVFECPLSAVRNDMGLPSTCSDSQAGSISQLQIHLLRHHNIAVNYCVVCSRIIVDTNLFELNHGTNCRDPRPPPRRILAMQQQWKDMYVSLRQKIESTADDVPVDDRKQKDSTQLATGPEDDTTCLIPQRPEEGLKREEETLKHDEISKADYPVSAEVCLCPAQSKASTEKYERHALSELADRLPSAWEEVQDLLPESYKWDIEYVITHHQGRLNPGCWTCAPLDGVNSQHIPLSIAGTPVVIPVEHQWPPVGDLHPPPDPRPSTIIDCYTELPMDTIRDIFITFDGSLGFYILISGFLQIIVSDTFDTTWASSHLPHKYGGLKVCYISNTLEPTMLQSNVATTPRAGGLPHTQPSNVLSASKPVRSGGLLQLNDFIEARVSSTSRDKFAGRIGLRVAKDSQPYLVMSTHTITEAILSKSFFGLNREPMKRLQDDWNKHAEIWAGNVKVYQGYYIQFRSLWHIG